MFVAHSACVPWRVVFIFGYGGRCLGLDWVCVCVVLFLSFFGSFSPSRGEGEIPGSPGFDNRKGGAVSASSSCPNVERRLAPGKIIPGPRMLGRRGDIVYGSGREARPYERARRPRTRKPTKRVISLAEEMLRAGVFDDLLGKGGK